MTHHLESQQRFAASAAAAAAGTDDESSIVAVTWRSDAASSDVTSLPSCRPTSEENNGPLLCTARRLILELQALLPDDDEERARAAAAGMATRSRETRPLDTRQQRPVASSVAQALDSPQAIPIKQQEISQQQQQQQQQQQPPVLELQACNGVCLVFANCASFLPTADSADANAVADSDADAADVDDDCRQRAGQIRVAASAIGQLFNGRLEFTVLVHWNKSRREILRLLRQAAAVMSDNRDCCFAFFLGKGGPGHFAGASGGAVTLADIVATLAVGQRSRLPVFVFGDLASDGAPDAAGSGRLNLPSNQLLLWTLGVPETADMLVDQLARSHLSGGKDVASTVSGIAEWIRRRGKSSSSSSPGSASVACRFLSKLDRLVYLASPDCI